MATRKTARTRPSAPVATPAVPAAPAAAAAPARPRRPGAPRRAKKVASEVAAGLTIAPPTHEEIRVRAYYLSLERGGPSADPLADWFRAEQELVASRAVTGDEPVAART